MPNSIACQTESSLRNITSGIKSQFMGVEQVSHSRLQMAGLESFYGREDLADIYIIITKTNDRACDGESRRKRARTEELVLPGHRLAVCAASEVLNAQVRGYIHTGIV
jgi:hypothetical protein